MRGSRDEDAPRDLRQGSIPACAGKPPWTRFSAKPTGVYPRVCGEAREVCEAVGVELGLSPRVRGSPSPASARPRSRGSIPACAGKPTCFTDSAPRSRVYPRVCGEAFRRMAKLDAEKGLSPRVRGSPGRESRVSNRNGSIPACAGKPRRRSKATSSTRGLSPRVRGSRRQTFRPLPQMGSIPACAGKPSPLEGAEAELRVYPRVCGEAACRIRPLRCSAGLSPRVRGSRRRGPASDPAAGSIPACAGKPASSIRTSCPPRVYPRVCGEAVSFFGSQAPYMGLSPRVRGSLAVRARSALGQGSIPACAGKPDQPSGDRSSGRVYPRVCGEARRDVREVDAVKGLSPRVRGSRPGGWRDQSAAGSIPACAGKPDVVKDQQAAVTVYPRVCGEALVERLGDRLPVGLSPRVRGSRCAAAYALFLAGSIPACAGKPEER